MTKKKAPESRETSRAKVPQTEFPNNTLESSIRVPQALWDNFAGKGGAPHNVAMALDLSPTSGRWRDLCGSSIAYGLTEGGYAAAEITLTDLGRRIVAPEEDNDDIVAKMQAILNPRIMRTFYEKYDRAKFPKDSIAKNVLIGMGLPKDRADKAFKILIENGEFTRVVRETKTGLFVALDDTPSPKPGLTKVDKIEVERNADGTNSEPVEQGHQKTQQQTEQRPNGSTRQIFIAHGKNRRPLEALKKILDKFKVPYKIAVEEPNAGRPISQKVADLMKSCSAGIFVFTKDEKFTRDNDEVVWRPSENVVYELGAGSILWGKKIIILRESGVNFPSDFNDLGYITFEDGGLDSRGLEILGELVAFEFVKVQAT